MKQVFAPRNLSLSPGLVLRGSLINKDTLCLTQSLKDPIIGVCLPGSVTDAVIEVQIDPLYVE
jgi:hypothetical protein